MHLEKTEIYHSTGDSCQGDGREEAVPHLWVWACAFLWAEVSRMWWDALQFLSFSFTSYLNSGRG